MDSIQTRNSQPRQEEAGRSRKKKKSILRIIVNEVLLILLIINIIVICMGESIGQSAINRMPVSLIPILSDSMKPLIKSGDAIITRQKDFADIQTGDVVVFSKDGDLIVHQVIDRDEDKLITKGIANEAIDIPVTENEYKAIMIGKVPFLGGIWRISSNPVKFAILIILIVLLIFGRDIFEGLYERFVEKKNEGEISQDN